MILYEFEGKDLLKQAGIKVPESQLITSEDSGQARMTLAMPVVLKAQVLSGKRAGAGGIIIVDSSEEFRVKSEELLGKVINKEKVEKVLVEEKVDIEKEFYVSISYNTDLRQPVLAISEQGGTGIEEQGFKTFPIDPITKSVILVSEAHPESEILKLVQDDMTNKLVSLFFDQDCLLLEINPLVKTKQGEWIALDAKIKLDDTAIKRHEEWKFEPRGVPGYQPTKNEIEAKKIDEGDYRGTAGSAYFDLDGDIAVLSSGGGVSLTAMDALIASGGKPANFTEYSGNPPREKVVKLTKVVLSKPNIHGLWVIGTTVANFTDIYETLSGLVEGLRKAEKELNTKFNFPIVIRRGGPREKEAFEMLREVDDFDIHLCPETMTIDESAKLMTELAEKYKERSSR